MEGKTSLIILTDENFEQEIMDNQGLSMVHFCADWSGPCHIMAPVIRDLSELFSGLVKTGRLDVEKNIETKKRFGIRSIPSLLFFKSGMVVGQVSGAVSRKELKGYLDTLLGESFVEKFD